MRTIIAVLAVALMTASSSTAAFVVTSRNIKNGTIQLADISPKAKKALRGQRGPRGPKGIEEVTVVTAARTIPPGVGGVSVEAICPAGQQPISGGFTTTGLPAVSVSAPNFSQRAWIVVGNAGPTAAAVGAVAYCAENVNIIPLGTQ